ncbi:MAG TPA: DsbA family protein [Pseudonocardiaceae bacterium]
MRKVAAPRFYFSLRSPYSWLAFEDLYSRYPDIVSKLDWRPFFEPDEQSERMLTEAGGRFVYTPMSKEKHLYILQDVRRLATERELEVGWPVDRAPCWEVPHLAYLAARENCRGLGFIDLAYQARWGEGRNICDPAVIEELGDRLGLDGAELATAHESERYRKLGLDTLMDLYQDDVFGIPLFVNGRQKYWGLDRLATFAAAVRADKRFEPAPRAAELAVVADPRASDFGPAGGCG